MNARENLEAALLAGDAQGIIAAQRELELQAAVNRAQRIAELRAELAELDAERPDLARATNEARRAAIALQDATRAAQLAENLAWREHGNAMNVLSQNNDRRRQAQAELDELVAAVKREVQTSPAPVVRSLPHARR